MKRYYIHINAEYPHNGAIVVDADFMKLEAGFFWFWDSDKLVQVVSQDVVQFISVCEPKSK